MDHNNTRAFLKVDEIKRQIHQMRSEDKPYDEILDFIRSAIWNLYSKIGSLFSNEGYNRLTEIFIEELNNLY